MAKETYIGLFIGEFAPPDGLPYERYVSDSRSCQGGNRPLLTVTQASLLSYERYVSRSCQGGNRPLLTVTQASLLSYERYVSDSRSCQGGNRPHLTVTQASLLSYERGNRPLLTVTQASFDTYAYLRQLCTGLGTSGQGLRAQARPPRHARSACASGPTF